MKVYSGEFRKLYDPSYLDKYTSEQKKWYINDHCIIKKEGVYHLFGITHEEPANPLEEKSFAHATGISLSEGMFVKQPDAFGYDKDAYESHLWAPHVVLHEGLYYMFYCAGSAFGNNKYRIHLATSRDLFKWERHPENPMIIDGYDARDPMILKIGDKWIMYYTCNISPEGGNHCVACVESCDLVHWGNKRNVFVDEASGTFGGPCESPFVVKYEDKYYLFIGPRKEYADTDIFESDNPYDFSEKKCVGNIKAHACEVIFDNDKYYITHCGWGQGGVYIAPLIFEK